LKRISKQVEEKVLKFINLNKLIDEKDKILVALSGGADSVFLLSFLHKYQKKFKIEICAVHINHNLRGEKARLDEKFCSNICKKLNIEFISISVDVTSYSKQNKISIEEAGRILRYKTFENILKEQNFNKIATAHNLNDNTETFFLNLIKGAGIKGLSGIPAARQNIIRPILNIPKDEIFLYLKENEIKYCTDLSNNENIYQRNFLRNEILPALRKHLNPNLDNSIANTSVFLKDVYNFFEKNIFNRVIKKIVTVDVASVFIVLTKFRELGLEESLKKEIIRRILIQYFAFEANYIQVTAVYGLMENQTGKKIKLGENLFAYRERDKLVITKNQNIEHEEIKISSGDSVKCFGKIFSITSVKKTDVKYGLKKNVEFISGDNLLKEFVIRRWKEGDRFFPFGMNQSKKVSDFLSDIKIPSYQKKEQTVLVNKNKIVWITGLRIDNRFRIKSTTKSFIKLEVENG